MFASRHPSAQFGACREKHNMHEVAFSALHSVGVCFCPNRLNLFSFAKANAQLGLPMPRDYIQIKILREILNCAISMEGFIVKNISKLVTVK